ncbi:MAG: homoprotocatechuate degradation regulator HpaR [Verrucomicrobiales bacterium]|jgi:homoprotocatechuate degradation regulator HpaR
MDSLPMRPFDESLPMALLAARETTMRAFRPMLAEHDLTEQQWRILRALTASQGPLEVAPLADRTSLLAPSVSRILANLEQRKLIERRTVEHDQRRSLISLTAVGVRLVRRIAPHSEDTYTLIEAQFGATRLRKLLVELHSLAALEIIDGKMGKAS